MGYGQNSAGSEVLLEVSHNKIHYIIHVTAIVVNRQKVICARKERKKRSPFWPDQLIEISQPLYKTTSFRLISHWHKPTSPILLSLSSGQRKSEDVQTQQVVHVKFSSHLSWPTLYVLAPANESGITSAFSVKPPSAHNTQIQHKRHFTKWTGIWYKGLCNSALGSFKFNEESD